MPARFTRLKLANWRNFKSVDIPLGQRAFVVGPNASGKTNLLDALRFLRDIAAPGGSLVNSVGERRGFKHLRSLHATYNSKVLVEVELLVTGDEKSWVYALELSGSERRKEPLQIDRERVLHGEEEILSRTADKEQDSLLLTQTHLEQASQNRGFRPLVEALSSVTHVHLVPQVARTPARSEEFSRREAPGSDFIEQLARMSEGQQGRVLRRIEKLLKIAVPKFSELQVVRDKVGRPHLEARYEHWRKRGGWQNEQEFSDGTLRLIGVLWAIGQGSEPLLLEEPELSLHREIIRQLPRILATAAQRSNRQVMVSTHAEEILNDRGIAPSELILLQPSDQETKVYLGSDIPELVNAAKARLRLGSLVVGMTSPENIGRLAFAG